MSVVSKLVLTHVNGNDNVIILADGTEFVIINGAKHTRKFSANDSANIVAALTGIKTAIVAAKLAAGRTLLSKDKIVSVLCEDVDLDEVKYQVFNTVPSTRIKDTWPLTVITDQEVIELPVGVVDDLLKYLLAQGVEKAPTADMYSKIVFVNALPVEGAEEGVAYVLDKADGDKPANSAWLSIDGEWMELTDEESNETAGDNGSGDNNSSTTEDPKPAVTPEQPATPEPTTNTEP